MLLKGKAKIEGGRGERKVEMDAALCYVGCCRNSLK
jgi:hypothetical protein